jgi:hypothetical protein
MGQMAKATSRFQDFVLTKMTVSNFKNMRFRNNFKEFDSFEFLKFETLILGIIYLRSYL